MVLMLATAVLAHAALPGVDEFRAEALKQINAFRQEEGRAPVKLDDNLNALSLEWARQLATDGKLHHRTKADMYQIVATRGWRALNENLFMSSANTSVTDTIEAWKHSSGHRRNLLQENIGKIGLGIATGDAGGFYAVFNGAG
jgi:uncharacterized protein YkwD